MATQEFRSEVVDASFLHRLPNHTTATRDAIPVGRLTPGTLVWNISTKKINVWDGTQWVELTPTPTDLGIIYNCAAALQVGKAVYLDSSDHVDYAFAGLGGHPAIGISAGKPTATTVRVIADGKVVGAFVGLTPGAQYGLSQLVAGEIVSPPPVTGVPGSFWQKLGTAATGDTMDADVDSTVVYFK